MEMGRVEVDKKRIGNMLLKLWDILDAVMKPNSIEFS